MVPELSDLPMDLSPAAKLLTQGLRVAAFRASTKQSAVPGGNTTTTQPPKMPPPIIAPALSSSTGKRPVQQGVLLTPVAWPATNTLSEEQLSAQAKTMKSLRLDQLAGAILCVPSGYDDMRYAFNRLADTPLEQKSILALTLTDEPTALDTEGVQVSHHGYDDIWSAPYKRYWEFVRQVRFNAVDAGGARATYRLFGGWNLRGSQRSGSILIRAEAQPINRTGVVFLRNVSAIHEMAAGRIFARYQGPGSTVSEEAVRTLVCQALSAPEHMANALDILRAQSMLSDEQLLGCIENHPWRTLDSWLMSLHRPYDIEEAQMAMALAKAIAIESVKHVSQVRNSRSPHPKAAIQVTEKTLTQVIASLSGITLTPEQRAAVGTITQRLQHQMPANIIITGDVGTGKTLTFSIPAVVAHLHGAQVAMVCPTEILANQLYSTLTTKFPMAKVTRVYAGQKSFDPDAIAVGTSGMAGVAAKMSWKPHLLIVDEQHKLSAQDRSNLAADWTHKIEASATPVPRSMATCFFGGVEMIGLGKPPVKRDISSAIGDAGDRARASALIKSTTAEGGRTLIVYPAVIGSSATAARTGLIGAQEAMEKSMPQKVGIIHGKMTSEQTQISLDDFKSGAKPILLASTVVETGVDIPDIRLMIIRDADNFGISQLHQLRGRMCRNGGRGHFIMYVDEVAKLSEETLQRLETVRDCNDGYELAAADMMHRGFGAMLGDAQSGTIQTPFRMLALTLADFDMELVSQSDTQSESYSMPTA